MLFNRSIIILSAQTVRFSVRALYRTDSTSIVEQGMVPGHMSGLKTRPGAENVVPAVVMPMDLPWPCKRAP